MPWSDYPILGGYIYIYIYIYIEYVCIYTPHMYISYTCILNPISYINIYIYICLSIYIYIYIYIYISYNLHRKFTITKLFQNMRAPEEKIKIKK